MNTDDTTKPRQASILWEDEGGSRSEEMEQEAIFQVLKATPLMVIALPHIRFYTLDRVMNDRAKIPPTS